MADKETREEEKDTRKAAKEQEKGQKRQQKGEAKAKREQEREEKKAAEAEESAPAEQNRGGGSVRRAAVSTEETPLVDETREFDSPEEREKAQSLRGGAGVARPTDNKGKEHYVGYRPIIPRSDEPNTRDDVETNLLDGMPVRVKKAPPTPNEGMGEPRLANPGSGTVEEKRAQFPHLGLKEHRGVTRAL